MTLAIVVGLWLAGVAAVVAGVLFAVFGFRRLQLATAKPLAERMTGSPFSSSLVQASIDFWLSLYDEHTKPTERKRRSVEDALRLVVIEWRKQPWAVPGGTGGGVLASGQYVAGATPRIYLLATETLGRSALAHELLHLAGASPQHHEWTDDERAVEREWMRAFG